MALAPANSRRVVRTDWCRSGILIMTGRSTEDEHRQGTDQSSSPGVAGRSAIPKWSGACHVASASRPRGADRDVVVMLSNSATSLHRTEPCAAAEQTMCHGRWRSPPQQKQHRDQAGQQGGRGPVQLGVRVIHARHDSATPWRIRHTTAARTPHAQRTAPAGPARRRRARALPRNSQSTPPSGHARSSVVESAAGGRLRTISRPALNCVKFRDSACRCQPHTECRRRSE
jgi:hypothetical protein